MSADLQRVTGKEAFWGDIKPTSSQLELINRSPTFVVQIHEADARVKTGQIPPMAVKDIPGPRYQVSTGQIQFPPHAVSGSDEHFLGNLAHEIGHLTYARADDAFEAKYKSHLRDPNAYNAATMSPIRAQVEAHLNHWKIYNEILKNTATPGHPGTAITANLDAQLAQLFDAHDARNSATALPQKQNENELVLSGMQSVAIGAAEGPDSTYNYHGHLMTGGAPVEPGAPTAISYSESGNGDIVRSSQTWRTGDVTTQTYQDGKARFIETVDASGKTLQTLSYAHNPDGSYRVDMKDGAGRAIRQSVFNADGSGVEHGYRLDGSTRETQFDARNQTTRMIAYDRQGRETQKDYFDAEAGLDTNQVVTRADGSRVLYSFNDRGKVGLQTDYGADGKRVATTRYDPDSGRVTFVARYAPDGSGTAYSVGADGKGTWVDIGKDGNRSLARTVQFSRSYQRVLDARAGHAATIAAPQPVGAESALGGQRLFFDSANNRLTNQIVENPDGSRTLNSFDDHNQVGAKIDYDNTGRRVRARYYDRNSGELSQFIDYGADGGRVVSTPGSGFVVQKTYNPLNQLKQVVRTDGHQTQIVDYDPRTGQVTNRATTTADAV
jgi:hypothetical protein